MLWQAAIGATRDAQKPLNNDAVKKHTGDVVGETTDLAADAKPATVKQPGMMAAT